MTCSLEEAELPTLILTDVSWLYSARPMAREFSVQRRGGEGKDWRMYCSECGAEASGKFCSSCGAPLTGGETPSPVATAQPIGVVPADWDRDDPHYATIVGLSAVRALLTHEATTADHPMSANEFLERCEKALPVPVPLVPLVQIVGPLYERLGIKTGRTETREFSLPAGIALVGVLTSLARHGNEVWRVEQADDGCVIHAGLKSTMWHGKGDLVVTVKRQPSGTSVEAATKIPGQLFDWGQSKLRLAALFWDIADARVQEVVGP